MNTTRTANLIATALVGALAFTTATPVAQAQSHYDELANLPFKEGYVTKDNVQTLRDELFFQRAVQTYLWHCRRSICMA